MQRRRFLVVAAAISAALFAPRQTLAASSTVVSVRVVRGPRQLLVGSPGRCAGARRTNGIAAILPRHFRAIAADR